MSADPTRNSRTKAARKTAPSIPPMSRKSAMAFCSEAPIDSSESEDEDDSASTIPAAAPAILRRNVQQGLAQMTGAQAAPTTGTQPTNRRAPVGSSGAGLGRQYQARRHRLVPLPKLSPIEIDRSANLILARSSVTTFRASLSLTSVALRVVVESSA